jgi:hypothetical protein
MSSKDENMLEEAGKFKIPTINDIDIRIQNFNI